jgi:hypothetical protein
MTYGLENLTEDQKKIKELFELYKKERRWLRNFSERTLSQYQAKRASRGVAAKPSA